MTITTTTAEAAYIAPRFGSPFFTDADDESAVEAGVVRRAPLTEQEIEAFCAELEIKHAIWKQEKARQAQAEQDAADLITEIERRGTRRMVVKVLTGVAALAAVYGAGRYVSIRTAK